ncbi:lysine transporter LysE [Streptomyces sp. NPDC048350]|uniref:lysine transporter LysE n=1 Tax=Streptomyces sp. NPDC048350 TaxID=3365538 RepID=UPI00371CE808
MRVRSVAKGVGEFLTETVGEFVTEIVLTVLATALLAGLVLAAWWSWSHSPRLTGGGGALLALLVAHGAWAKFRDPAVARRRRGLAAVTSAGFTAVAATAVFLLLYAEISFWS